MRLFVLMQSRRVSEAVGVDESFRRLLSEGVLSAYEALPYYGSAEERGWPATWEWALHQIRQMRADVVFLQYFHGPIPDPTGFIETVKQLPWRPTVVTSSGDGFGRFTRRPPASLRIASRLSDLTFATQMGGVARDLVRGGSRRVTLMPHGYCQVRFSATLDPEKYAPEFDVVMIGTQVRCRNPGQYMFYAGLQRYRQAAALQRQYGKRFGLFGPGWDGWASAQGPIAYDRQVETCRRARVVVGAAPYAGMDYYMSDRDVIAMRSGVPFVELQVPRTERIFRQGQDWHLVQTLPEMLDRCEKLLTLTDAECLAMGARAAARMEAGHSQYHRARTMLDIIRSVRDADLAGRPAPLPQLDFFASGIRLEDEWPYAVLGWA
jgi:hypothetical protein